MPASAYINPFLNIEVPGINIQKAERTKNSNPKPKKILKKNKGSPDFAL